MSATTSSSTRVADRLGRPLRDLRISVTDRCNFRCRYCMPREAFGPDHAFVEREELLTFEEVARLVRVAVGLGVRKVRLTGGEPLIRRGLPDLVGMLAAIDGVDDLALTTNGSLLAGQAGPLAAAGLHRVTVSLDALDGAIFRAVSDTNVPVEVVLDGIAVAADAGLRPVKLNAVVKRGVNDGDEVVRLAAYAREHGHVARFIEYMDVGTTNGWRMDDVVPAREIVDRIGAVFPLEPMDPDHPGAVATRYRYRDGRGEIGVVASGTRPFCATCVRARISPVGELFTCLFASRGRDLREVLRAGASDDELAGLLAAAWSARNDRYSELRSAASDGLRSSGTTGLPRVEMSYIGG